MPEKSLYFPISEVDIENDDTDLLHGKRKLTSQWLGYTGGRRWYLVLIHTLLGVVNITALVFNVYPFASNNPRIGLTYCESSQNMI